MGQKQLTQHPMTADEFYLWLASQNERYELVDGQPMLMAGATIAHDTFVMNAWKDDQKADKITFIPDGNGEFTAGMGQLVEKEDLGFGKRSWRYSMLVKDGVVEKMFIEPNEPGDPFKVSDADTMLKYLDPSVKVQESVALFTKPGCPYCAKAKQLLIDRGIQYEEIILGKDATTVSLRAVTGRTSVPQVFIGGQHIGGSDDLETYLAK